MIPARVVLIRSVDGLSVQALQKVWNQEVQGLHSPVNNTFHVTVLCLKMTASGGHCENPMNITYNLGGWKKLSGVVPSLNLLTIKIYQNRYNFDSTLDISCA